MTPEDETLIEQVVGAYRGRDVTSDRIQEHPAFADLDAAGRERAYWVTLDNRRLEAALDPNGLSTTGNLVLSRIRAALPR